MHYVRAATLTGFSALIQSLGLELAPLLRQAGLNPECLDKNSIDQYLPLSQLEVLYSLAEQESAHFDLAARLGSQQELTPLLGVLGFVMQQSNTVAEALRKLQHYFSFQLQGAFLNLHIDQGYVIESLVVENASDLPSIRHTAEFAMAAGVAIMQSLCGHSWRPSYVEFIHANPNAQRRLEQYYYSSVRFNQTRNALVFPATDLQQPITLTDQQLHSVMQNNLDMLEAQFANDIPKQVEQLIYQAMMSGQCDIKSVAVYMGVHQRTLQRSLLKTGTNFSELYTKVRKNTALVILQHTQMSLIQLAQLLGYSELSAFSRAFKTWFNLSPKQWRQRQQNIL